MSATATAHQWRQDPGYDRSIGVNEVRGGLRYQFGNSDCIQPVPYVPEPEPVYTK